MRPEGWDKQFHGLRADASEYSTAPQNWEGMRLMSDKERIIYEAGADAMLEGLKKNRIRSAPSGRIAGEIAKTYGNMSCKIVGYLVFIPEEK